MCCGLPGDKVHNIPLVMANLETQQYGVKMVEFPLIRYQIISQPWFRLLELKIGWIVNYSRLDLSFDMISVSTKLGKADETENKLANKAI